MCGYSSVAVNQIELFCHASLSPSCNWTFDPFQLDTVFFLTVKSTFHTHLWIFFTPALENREILLTEKVKWSQAYKDLLELQREEWWYLCSLKRLAACKEFIWRLRLLCVKNMLIICAVMGNRQPWWREQSHMGEPGLCKKTGHCDIIKTGKNISSIWGSCGLDQLVKGRSNTCTSTEKIISESCCKFVATWRSRVRILHFGNVCGLMVPHVITDQHCVSGHEAERTQYSWAELWPSSALTPKLEWHSYRIQFENGS